MMMQWLVAILRKMLFLERERERETPTERTDRTPILVNTYEILSLSVCLSLSVSH